MRKWAKQYTTEIRLLSRNLVLMSLPVVYTAIFWFAMWMTSQNPMGNLYYSMERFNSVGHTMTIGVAIFIGISLARRDSARPAYEWSKSYPISSAAQLTAKYAATLSYLTIFTILIAVSALVFGLMSGFDMSVLMPRILYFAIQYEISYAVTVALGMLLSMVIVNRAVYLIGFCAWMFGTFFMEIYIMERFGWHVLKTFHLSQLFIESGKWYQTWSMDLFATELNTSRVFVVTFTLFLLIVSILLMNYKRPVNRLSTTWVAALCALALSCGAFIPYSLIWAEKNDKVEAILNDPNIKMEGEALFGNSDIFSLSYYDLTLTQADDDVIMLP